MSFCEKCGKPLGEGALFCMECGAPMEPITAAAPAPESSAPPVRKKSGKKKVFAVVAIVTVLALLVGVGTFFLRRNDAVYLCVSETWYDADGTEWTHIEYTYNQQGSLLCSEKISADQDWSEVFNEELGVYEYTATPNGGKCVRKMEYAYNDEGHCIYDTDSYKVFDAEGNPAKLDQHSENSTKDWNYTYRYNDDGTVKAVDFNVALHDTTGDYAGQTRYYYNDEGRLVEISSYNEKLDRVSYARDYRYDDEGRLITYAVHKMEGMVIYQYEYNEDGQVTSAEIWQDYGQAPLDEDCISESYVGIVPSQRNLECEVRFEYDSQGNLVFRKLYDPDGGLTSTTECAYEGEKLTRVTYDSMTVIYTDSEADVEDIAEDTVVMVRDRHGNVVKAVAADGSWVEYEYEKFDLSAEEAQQCRSILYFVNRMDITGSKNYNETFGGSCGFVSCVSFPTTDLYQTDVLIREYYH